MPYPILRVSGAPTRVPVRAQRGPCPPPCGLLLLGQETGAGPGPRCLGGKRARDEPARQCFGGGVVREDH